MIRGGTYQNQTPGRDFALLARRDAERAARGKPTQDSARRSPCPQGAAVELASAGGDASATADGLTFLDRGLDQTHRHGPSSMGAGEKLFGRPLILLGLGQIPQGPFHFARHSRRPLAQAPRLDGRTIPLLGLAVDFHRTAQKEQVSQ